MKKLIIITILLLCSICCYAEFYQMGPLPASVPKDDTMSALKARELRWQTEKWTGSDLPFIETQQKIEASLTQGVSLQAMLNEAEVKAIQKPYEPTAQYEWCYLAYKSVITYENPDGRDTKYNFLRQKLSNSIQGMIFGKQPHSYAYSRLLFLARVHCYGGSDYLTIGQRLFDRNSLDDEVRSSMIDIYMDSDPPRTLQALNNLRYLLLNPSSKIYRAHLYDKMGDVYLLEFNVHKHKEDADAAIENWQKAINLYPKLYDPRLINNNLSWIHKVENEQAHKAGGK